MLLIFSSNEWKYRTGKTLFSGTNPERLITLLLAHSTWFYAFFTFSDSSISISLIHSWKGGGSKFLSKGSSDISHEKGWVGEIGEGEVF